jgi:hypothetical protein
MEDPEALEAFRIARRAGLINVGEMLESIPPGVWKTWRAFERIEPGNETRICEVLALVGAAICNALGSSEVRPEYFWRNYADQIEVEESPRLQRAKLRLVAAAQNAGVSEGVKNGGGRKPGRKSLPQLFFPDGRIE